VALEAHGHDPIVLDLGTGLRFWGETLDATEPFRGSALLTHIHWDHVQGLPFFTPVLKPGACFDVYGPPQPDEGTLEQAFNELMRPPFFPVKTADLLGDIAFHDVWEADLELDGAKVKVRPVPHVGLTNGYRVEMGGAVVAYISDHQMPLDGSHGVSDAVLELCDGADLLIHDAQYTVEEFPAKSTWGHCTVDYAVHVAKEAGVGRLALFHHDPTHDDDAVDAILAHAQGLGEASGLTEVVAAQEGLVISFP
jgi:phosphoribosyl 1,2-cyclic phosphodiesterase